MSNLGRSHHRRWRGVALGGHLQRGCRFCLASQGGQATTGHRSGRSKDWLKFKNRTHRRRNARRKKIGAENGRQSKWGVRCMANDEHVALLKKGVEAWNAWRDKNPDIRPDLSGAKLSRRNLRGADLSQANVNGARLSRAHLNNARFNHTELNGARMDKADL